MPPADFLHALPGALLVAFLPGLGLAVLVAAHRSWWEQVLLAPGLGVGLVGMVGLVYHDVHVPFLAASVLPVLVVPPAVALWSRWSPRADPGRSAPSPPGHPSVREMAPTTRLRLPAWGALTGVLAGLLTAGSLAVAIRDEPLPVWNDAALHGSVAQGVVEQHDAVPLLPEPADNSAWVRPHAAFEDAAALVSELGGNGPARSMMPLVILVLIVMPLSLTLMALEVLRSRRLAIIAPILGVGMVFPQFVVNFGGFPLLADSTLVAPLAVAALRVVRECPTVRDLLLMGTCVASIWVTHGLEALTAAVLAGPPILVALLEGRRLRATWVGLACGLASSGAAALLVTLMTRTPDLPPSTDASTAPSESVAYFVGHPGLGLTDALRAVIDINLTTPAMVLVACGLVAAVRHGRLWFPISTSAVLVVCLADIAFSVHLRWLWVHTYPWSSSDRFIGLQWWLLPLIAAGGLIMLIDRATDLVRLHLHRAHIDDRFRRVAGVGFAVIAVLSAAGGLRQDADNYSARLIEASRVSDADVSALAALDHALRPGALILNNGVDDAGEWVGALGRDTPVLPKSYATGHPDDWRVVAVASACTDPAGAEAALAGIDAVFVGAKPAIDSHHAWDWRCIATLNGARIITQVNSGDRVAVGIALMARS